MTGMLEEPLKSIRSQVSILDESLFTGERKPYRLLCTIDREFISVAIADTTQSKFAGFEGIQFPKPLNDEQLVSRITDLTRQSSILKKVEFRNVSVQFANSSFTFIPSALFKPEDAEKYFYFNHPALRSETIHHENVRAYDLVNIFSVPEPLMTACRKIFERFSVHHHMTSLLEAMRYQPASDKGPVLFVHVHSSAADVVVTDGQKLLLANSFSFRSVEDAAYYILMVCGQLSVYPEKTELHLAGEVEQDAPLVKQLQNYFPHIVFAGRIPTIDFTYGFGDLPMHYYHSAFSHILCES